MLPLERLTHPSNVLELNQPMHFLNTANIFKSCYTPGYSCSYNREFDAVWIGGQPNYFSGYVFRGDTRPPEHIFEEGFEVQIRAFNEATQAQMMGATGRGSTGQFGISTSICASAASAYSFKSSNLSPYLAAPSSGYVYLIDATEFKGFALPSPYPQHPMVQCNPILKEIYEVNFASNIPGSYIVGIVWVLGNQAEGNLYCTSFWPYTPGRLWLAVNPNFEKSEYRSKRVLKGMMAAEIVQDHLNMIDAL